MTTAKTKVIRCEYTDEHGTRCNWTRTVNASSARKNCPEHVLVMTHQYQADYRKRKKEEKKEQAGRRFEKEPKARRHSPHYGEHIRSMVAMYGVQRDVSENAVYLEANDIRYKGRKF